MLAPLVVACTGLLVVSGRELAVVRPFASKEETRHLETSFDSWNRHEPCSGKTRTSVDLFLVYSQSLRQKSDVATALDRVVEKFKQRKEAWHMCFRGIHVLAADLTASQDVYDASHPDKENWVNGPNTVFRFILQHFLGSKYEAFFLMEMDAIPKKAKWLEQLETEVLDYPAAAIRGSQYRGYRWNHYWDSLPEALRDHINGNAIYNTSHPFLAWLSMRLEQESQSKRNAIPYDLRMAELVLSGRSRTNPGCAEAWDDYVEVGENPYAADSRLIGNYAATLLNKSFTGGEFISHGSEKNIFDEMDFSKLSLAVSYISDAGIDALTESLAHSRSFSKVVVLKPGKAFGDEMHATKSGSVSLQWKSAMKTAEEAFCELVEHVETEFFLFQTGNRRIHQAATVLVDESRPVVPFLASDSIFCRKDKGCTTSVSRAAELFKVELKRHYNLMDTIFKTRTAREFCSSWENMEQSRAPSADDYMAWQMSRQAMEREYHEVDRTEKGWHILSLEDPTIVEEGEIMDLARRMQGSGVSNASNESNLTLDCDGFFTGPSCDSAFANLCTWDGTLGECRRNTPKQRSTQLLITVQINTESAAADLRGAMSVNKVEGYFQKVIAAATTKISQLGRGFGRLVVTAYVRVVRRARIRLLSPPTDQIMCDLNVSISFLACGRKTSCRVIFARAIPVGCVPSANTSARLLGEEEDTEDRPTEDQGDEPDVAVAPRFLQANDVDYDVDETIRDSAEVAGTVSPDDPGFLTAVQAQVTGLSGATAEVTSTSAETFVQVITEEGLDVNYVALQDNITAASDEIAADVGGAFGVNTTSTTDLCLDRTCGGRGVCGLNEPGVCACEFGWAQPNCIVPSNETSTMTETMTMTATTTMTNTTTITTTTAVMATTAPAEDDNTALIVVIACLVLSCILLLLLCLWYFMKPPAAAPPNEAPVEVEDAGRSFI